MNARKIVIDGKTYNSVDEMPEEVRRQYEAAMQGFKDVNAASFSEPMDTIHGLFADRDNNGMPDIFEGAHSINFSGLTKFVVDGKTYDSLDDLPPEARARYEQAMGSIDRNRNGLPDVMESFASASVQASPAAMTGTGAAAEAPRRTPRPPIAASPTITPDTSNGWLLALAALALLFVCAAGAIGIWYVFLR